MLLSELHKGEEAKIVGIEAEKTLRDRFNSLGITRGEHLSIRELSLAKQTIEIEIGHTLIALRVNEAAKVKVVQCKEESK